VSLDRDGAIRLALEANNLEAHARLTQALETTMNKTAEAGSGLDRFVYVHKTVPIEGVSHQAGTLRFGSDARTNVLDLDCKAHGLDNLYVTDSSFFPSIGAVNPTLTIVANALRVADHIKMRLSA
jgi:Choline dehydrogenase and related flavoproteins